MTEPGLIEAAARRIRTAERVTILTGAGVSAASGVPTFRGPDGLWRRFRPEDLATPAAFERDPRLVWEWYAWRRERISACEPNPAHYAIAEWSRRSGGCRVLTQNVDDLHVRAGTEQLIRLHGSIWWLRCRAGRSNARSAACGGCGVRPWQDTRVPLPELPPRCPACGGLARPDVVWFGEPLDPAIVEAALDACNTDAFLTVGTSALVHPAAGLVHEAARRGAFTVEINAEPTPASALVDVAIHEPAEVVLPRLVELLASAG